MLQYFCSCRTHRYRYRCRYICTDNSHYFSHYKLDFAVTFRLLRSKSMQISLYANSRPTPKSVSPIEPQSWLLLSCIFYEHWAKWAYKSNHYHKCIP